MKYIIQSKVIGDTKWNYRSEATDHTKAILGIIDAKRQDIKLRMSRENSYRIVDTKEKVVFILPDDYNPLS